MRVQTWFQKLWAVTSVSGSDLLRPIGPTPTAEDICHIVIVLGRSAGAGSGRVLLLASAVETSPTTRRLDNSH